MNLVILLIVVALFAAIFLPTAWDTRALKFQEAADGTFHATISRFGKTYDIERTESPGSGRYIDFKITMIENTQAADGARAGRINVAGAVRTVVASAGATDDARAARVDVAGASRVDVATYSTCGHFRDEGTQLVIYEPHDFHCGFFSARINDLLWPRKSRVDFTTEGAVPSFLPSDER